MIVVYEVYDRKQNMNFIKNKLSYSSDLCSLCEWRRGLSIFRKEQWDLPISIVFHERINHYGIESRKARKERKPRVHSAFSVVTEEERHGNAEPEGKVDEENANYALKQEISSL